MIDKLWIHAVTKEAQCYIWYEFINLFHTNNITAANVSTLPKKEMSLCWFFLFLFLEYLLLLWGSMSQHIVIFFNRNTSQYDAWNSNFNNDCLY